MKGSRRSRRSAVAGIAAAAFGLFGLRHACDLALAQSLTSKPKPPAGLDPGGIAVALLGSGVDYRRPDIAKRLARDGEGELIAWDMIDNDARPFEAPQLPATSGAIAVLQLTGTKAAEVLLAEAPGSRLVPVRIADDSIRSLGAALAFTSRTPARVSVLLAATREAPWPVFAEAAQRAKHLLVIAPAGRPADRAAWGASRASDAAIVVTAVREDGSDWISGDDTPAWADVAIAVPTGAVDATGGAAQADPAASVAAAEAVAALRLAALAARVLARSPGLDGASLKAVLLGLAKPRVAAGGKGWIADIGRLP